MLTNIFTPSDCAACKLCCNFHRSSAWETPSLESELIYLLQEEGYPLHKRCNGATTFFLNFTTDSEDEVANCPMLDPHTGCTLPRELRPFECRIWPLRIMRDASTLVIGLYKDCPALNGAAVDKLINFATGELLSTMLDYARKHPTCIRDVDAAYSIIWREYSKFSIQKLFHVEQFFISKFRCGLYPTSEFLISGHGFRIEEFLVPQKFLYQGCSG